MPRAVRRLLSIALVVAVADCCETVRAQAPSSGSAPTQGWRVKFEGSGSRPVIVDGVLYVGAADGAVYAFDPVTGDTKWRFQTGASLSPETSNVQVIVAAPGSDPIAAALNAANSARRTGRRRVDLAPVVANGTVFVGSGDRSFYAIDAATGTMKWSYEAGDGMAANNNLTVPWPSAVIKNGSAYFVTDDGLHAVDTVTGKRQWLFETLEGMSVKGAKKRTPSAPVLGDGVLFLTAWPFARSDTETPKAFLYAVDASSGQARWVVTVDGGFVTPPVTADGLVFFSAQDPPPGGGSAVLSERATLFAVGQNDGQVKWKFSMAQRFSLVDTVLAAQKTVYFASDTSLSALDLTTGRQLWSFSSDQKSNGLWADDRHLYWLTRKISSVRPRTTIHALDLSTGAEKWSRRGGGNDDVGVISAGVLYGGSGAVYALDTATGKQLWSTKGLGTAHLIHDGKVFSISPTTTYFGIDKVDQGYFSAVDAKTGKLPRTK